MPTQKPRNPFPEWRLLDGIINAAESQLGRASDSCERWEWGCAGLVVVAVIAEFIIAGIHPPYDSFLEQWGTATADAVIALGIVGEVIFGRLDTRYQTELRKRSNAKLSDAIDRAAKLEKEAADARGRVADIERLTAWRRVSDEQTGQIAAAIRHMADDIDVLVEYDTSDKESWAYSLEITKVFVAAGVTKIRRTGNSFIGEIIFGIHMSASAPINLAFISNSFAKSQISVQITKTMDLSTHLPRNEVAPNLYVFVGPKPLPAFEEWVEFNAAQSRGVDPQKSANEAFRRATEVEERTAERRLTAEQGNAIAEAMNEYPTNILVSHMANDPESASYASEIKAALEAGGATVALWPTTFNGHIVRGLYIHAREGDSGEADRLMNALVGAGLPVTRSPATSNLLRLLVGHKPLPNAG